MALESISESRWIIHVWSLCSQRQECGAYTRFLVYSNPSDACHVLTGARLSVRRFSVGEGWVVYRQAQQGWIQHLVWVAWLSSSRKLLLIFVFVLGRSHIVSVGCVPVCLPLQRNFRVLGVSSFPLEEMFVDIRQSMNEVI